MAAKTRIEICNVCNTPSDLSEENPVMFAQVFAYTAAGYRYPDNHPHKACFYADIQDGNYVLYGLDRLVSHSSPPKIFRCLPVQKTSKKHLRNTLIDIMQKRVREYAEYKGIRPSQIKDHSSRY